MNELKPTLNRSTLTNFNLFLAIHFFMPVVKHSAMLKQLFRTNGEAHAT